MVTFWLTPPPPWSLFVTFWLTPSPLEKWRHLWTAPSILWMYHEWSVKIWEHVQLFAFIGRQVYTFNKASWWRQGHIVLSMCLQANPMTVYILSVIHCFLSHLSILWFEWVIASFYKIRDSSSVLLIEEHFGLFSAADRLRTVWMWCCRRIRVKGRNVQYSMTTSTFHYTYAM